MVLESMQEHFEAMKYLAERSLKIINSDAENKTSLIAMKIREMEVLVKMLKDNMNF